MTDTRTLAAGGRLHPRGGVVNGGDGAVTAREGTAGASDAPPRSNDTAVTSDASTAVTGRRAWRPSNGTDGEIFAANRCERCVNDRFDMEAGTGDSCPIWMTLLIGDHDPHVFWDDEGGHGECDMFCDRAVFTADGGAS